MDGEGQFVENIMNPDVISVDSSVTARDAATIMADAGVGCVVITDGKKPIGMVTERDLVWHLIAQNKPSSICIADIMSSPIIMTTPDAPIWELAQQMKANSIHKVPVQRDDVLVGIVTATDIVRAHSLASDSEIYKITGMFLNRT